LKPADINNDKLSLLPSDVIDFTESENIMQKITNFNNNTYY